MVGTLEIIKIIILGLFLVIEGIRDLRRHKVSMLSVALAGVIGVIIQIPLIKEIYPDMIGGILPGIILLLVAGFTKERIGYGDGWVMFVAGIYLGFAGSIYLLTLSLFIASLTSVLLLICKKAGRKTELPFVAFMVPGFLLMPVVL